MTITRDTIADRISAYLRHDITLSQLVEWSESAMMDGEVDARDAAKLTAAIARLGVADVRAFGLTWEDCQSILADLGYTARVEVVAA